MPCATEERVGSLPFVKCISWILLATPCYSAEAWQVSLPWERYIRTPIWHSIAKINIYLSLLHNFSPCLPSSYLLWEGIIQAKTHEASLARSIKYDCTKSSWTQLPTTLQQTHAADTGNTFGQKLDHWELDGHPVFHAAWVTETESCRHSTQHDKSSQKIVSTLRWSWNHEACQKSRTAKWT